MNFEDWMKETVAFTKGHRWTLSYFTDLTNFYKGKKKFALP